VGSGKAKIFQSSRGATRHFADYTGHAPLLHNAAVVVFDTEIDGVDAIACR
jgi:hypothetical protein